MSYFIEKYQRDQPAKIAAQVSSSATNRYQRYWIAAALAKLQHRNPFDRLNRDDRLLWNFGAAQNCAFGTSRRHWQTFIHCLTADYYF